VANLPTVSSCRWCVNYTGGKFASGINDTGGKFASSTARVVDTGGKFASGVNDNRGG